MTRSSVWKTVGILGGMGAEAGVELARRLIEQSGARTDAEQIPFALVSNPSIPDRVACLLRGGPSPLDELARSVGVLEAAGAELIAIACNTAHAWHGELARRTAVPIVHMIRTICARHDRTLGTRVGVLCTSGLASTGLYQSCASECGLTAVMSTDEEQDSLVMRAIYGDLDAGLVGLKGSNRSPEIVSLMVRAARSLVDRGASALWLACTEISLLKDELAASSSVPVVDAMDVLACEIVSLARR